VGVNTQDLGEVPIKPNRITDEQTQPKDEMEESQIAGERMEGALFHFALEISELITAKKWGTFPQIEKSEILSQYRNKAYLSSPLTLCFDQEDLIELFRAQEQSMDLKVYCLDKTSI
jgi:hypothetical protein